MCSYLTLATEVAGSGLRADDWFPVDRAAVYYDHPQDALLEHALCIDVHGDRPDLRVSVELDAASARRLAQTILAVLDDAETRALTTTTTRSS
jgi:hypothetical protein